MCYNRKNALRVCLVAHIPESYGSPKITKSLEKGSSYYEEAPENSYQDKKQAPPRIPSKNEKR